jgi:hypothetical protein
MSALGKSEIPKTVEEAMASEHKNEWLEAMRVELRQLIKQKVFRTVPRENGIKTVGTKWVFDLKLGPQGEILRYKARLVAKGFSQIEGLNYFDTFAPVVSKEALRALISVAATKDWEIDHVDIACAFLHGRLEEDVYCEIPQGFAGDKATRRFKIVRSLYGLKQAGRCYNKRLDEHLRKNKYMPTKADPCVYVKRGQDDQVECYLAVWVDDIFVFGTPEPSSKAKEILKQEFEIKDLGPAKWLLGLELIRDRVNRTATLSQTKYIDNMLAEFGMTDCKPKDTPLTPGADPLLSAQEGEVVTPQEKALMEKIPYRKAIGVLMYLSTTTRPDISAAVSQLSKFVDNPVMRHWVALKHLLRYLKHTRQHCLVLGGKGEPRLEGFSDSDWASNQEDRRSMGGYSFALGPDQGAIAWAAKRQQSVALSSLEAEYMALSDSARTAIWLRCLLEELSIPTPGPTVIQCDNQAAIFTANNPSTSPKSKHISIRYHFVRERVIETKEIQVKYIQTSKQVADIFTKSIKSVAQFEELRTRLGVRAVV